ncbi:mRNA splicing protein [Coemansia spiralis]|nr:mRNA splicing protein [Coemansia spiralis]
MSSITQFLPEPKNVARSRRPAQDTGGDADSSSNSTAVMDTGARSIPPYGQRQGWVPKSLEDFGDGGAYPEVRMLQFPLGMGKTRGTKSNALAKTVDADGNASYDALARHGRRENETVQSGFKDLIPLRQRKDFDDSQDAIPERPDADAVRDAAERTRLALEKKLGSRAKPVAARGARGGARPEPTYVRYTPNQQGAEYNSGASQRIVRVTDMPVDPMEPPKIRLQKQAHAPPSPPAPVMHSPPRKVTAEEQKEWTVPPCVSNWKNIHGFTVSLDKRLAADGRGSEEIVVNDNFARLSEALISAESHARKEISERAKIQQTLARREKEAKEERLRLLAQRAREERAANPRAAAEPTGGYVPPALDSARSAHEPGDGFIALPQDTPPRAAPAAQAQATPDRQPSRVQRGRAGAADFFDDRHRDRDSQQQRSRRRSQSPAGGDDEVRRRDEVRQERRKQHERDLRASRAGGRGQRAGESRDISERIALGIAQPTATRESIFDSRLFNQPSASNAALQNDEAYNLYDKPLFGAAASSSSNYRPRVAEDAQAAEVDRMMGSDRFGSHLAGLGAGSGRGTTAAQPARTGPVAFEKGDVFGIDAFADSARQAKDGKR